MFVYIYIYINCVSVLLQIIFILILSVILTLLSYDFAHYESTPQKVNDFNNFSINEHISYIQSHRQSIYEHIYLYMLYYAA